MVLLPFFSKNIKQNFFITKFANCCHQSQFLMPGACDNTCLCIIQINFLNLAGVNKQALFFTCWPIVGRMELFKRFSGKLDWGADRVWY